MSRERSERVQTAMSAVTACAIAGELANDPDAMIRALDETWAAVRRARETITDARDATRAEALDQLENAA